MKISGKAIKGKGKGRKLGFPTVNIGLKEKNESGVYEGSVKVGDKDYKAGIFVSPDGKLLEAHLIGFSGDLYGKNIEVEINRKLREIKKFENDEELKRQIKKDLRVIGNSDMFTGIIKKLSRVERVSWQKGSLFVEIKIPKGWKVKLGDSISINGVCSTVNRISRGNFAVEWMPETVKKTTVGNFQKGAQVNLERSLRLGDLMNGHMVQGHVDCVGKIIEIEKVKQSKAMKIQVPREFMKFMAPKGSVSVDGISLTIVESKNNWFTVSLVSYTLENTNLGKIKVGEKVNIETDAIAKYIFNILKSTEYAKGKKRENQKN